MFISRSFYTESLERPCLYEGVYWVGEFVSGACNHRIGHERTGSEVITGSDLILHLYNEFYLPQFEYFMSYLTQNISRACYEGKFESTRAPGPKIHLSKSPNTGG